MPYASREERNENAKRRYHERKANEPDFLKRKYEVRKAHFDQTPDAVLRRKEAAKRWYDKNGKEYQRKHKGLITLDEYLALCEEKTRKRAEELGADTSTPEGRRAYKRAYMRQWSQTDSGKRANVAHSIRRRCGITIDEYDAAYESQGGKCKICGEPAPKYEKGRLVVDHCHQTGRFRSLLCAQCNGAIGLFREKISILHAAVKYLKEEQQQALDLSPP